MWHWSSESLNENTIRFAPERDGKSLSWRDVLALWQDSADFREAFNRTLAGVPFASFRWETPAVTRADLDRAFEFVVVDSPELDVASDPEPFAEHFRRAGGESVVAFDNLGGDARLIVPSPLGPDLAYPHLAAFVRHAPAVQQQALWGTVGRAMFDRVGRHPVWLSTAGGGVAWLHVRLDDRPKYYAHAAYRDHRYESGKGGSGRRWLRLSALLILGAITINVLWTFWAERHPGQERDFRNLVQEQLREWFPDEMAPAEGSIGFAPGSDAFDGNRVPDVVLVHGLDEPGGIWNELIEAMDGAGLNAWTFRYPNDQAIDASADLLARHWTELDVGDDGTPIVLVGHSMGGLVIRDFVSRWRHPVGRAPGAEGPAVRGVILVGTPNQGSPWARLRIWLEVREMLVDMPSGGFSLFAGLRDGTGSAKIDLRPGSEFLSRLNARDWPNAVPVRIIGGRLGEPTPTMQGSIEALAEYLEGPGVAEALAQWWSGMESGLGDGVVPVDSLGLPEAPPPLLLPASHRGLLVAGPFNDGDPPAVAPVMEILETWTAD